MSKFLRILIAAAFWVHASDLICLAELGHDECHPHEEAGHEEGGEESPLACTNACALNHVAVVRPEADAPAPAAALGELHSPAPASISLPPCKDIFHPPA